MVPRMYSRPRAELYCSTMFPVETVYCLWEKSKRASQFRYTPEQIHEMRETDDVLGAEVDAIFRMAIEMDVPVARSIQYTFMIHDLPIALREQMVRHIIGMKFGDNYGVDFIPELSTSSFWSQSMRILNFDTLFDDERYFTPETILNNPTALDTYNGVIQNIQVQYRELLKLGIPMEDARGILPLHSNMDMEWTLNQQSLSHVLGKRSCWILQYGYWAYLIRTMIDELSLKIHPVYRDLVLPPCFGKKKLDDGTEGKRFNGCTFVEENERRMCGKDDLPVCPLFYHHEMDWEDRDQHDHNHTHLQHQRNLLAPKYGDLWGRDPYTGESK